MKLLNIFSIFTVVLTEKVSVNLTTHEINLKVLDSVDKFIYRGNNSAAEISQTPNKIPKFQIKISKGNQADDLNFHLLLNYQSIQKMLEFYVLEALVVDNFSRYLQYTTFTILSESQCYLAANIICSQPKTGTSSVEGGDSGGPSIIYENEFQHKLESMFLQLDL
ncbi:hypothetical protein PVAND_015426 [Polypedilum vanderplanki]|uniref:Uncharacterized protein n=1 Tax=Polypedilum vanderplanki TaxID=319348 RepID=A0A9J6BD10_POLVA|nr:hypothetical protein PVAND_015426 [Polypedilum vanderplanki]